MKRNIGIKGKILNKKGFTLVELIVVLAVIAIIAAIALPKYLGIQEKAKEDADYSTGVMLAKAAELYIAAEDTIPEPFTVKNLIDDGYYDTIVLQSKNFEGLAADSLNITHDGTKVTSIATTGTTPKELYVKPVPVTP